MNPGYVYILTNPSMPELVKIGRTGRDVDARASELWKTGVPTRFEIYGSEQTIDCVQLEGYMHRELQKHRVHKAREFFRVEPDLAREKLRFWAEIQAAELIGANFGCVTTVSFSTWVSSDAVERLANETKVPTMVIAEAMTDLTADELRPAIQRTLTRRAEEERQMLRKLGLLDDEAGQ